MTVNVGKTDQIVRAVVGLIFVIIPFTATLSLFDNSYAIYASVLIGAVLLLTSGFRICPIYSVLGIKTCTG
ncbi:Protein of unknown function (DUF2892) [Yoonia maritima]|uniref:Inner membrane protein YgaP-like transmembrane domain-containing protein n=1 Tax=Yoonia maritima TaxID=1435347 RepID=A0A2T0W5N6_9RHOB|nr:DUF2892 domain-containing protein [Yoonia maritima]PRY80552.1 Protein of unknown function (DUF2892) [Yoonia maritima]